MIEQSKLKFIIFTWGFPHDTMAKNPLANAGDTKDIGLIPGSGGSPGGGNGKLQYSCLENPMYGRTWWVQADSLLFEPPGKPEANIQAIS